MLFNNKLFNSIACLLSFTNLQLVIPGRTWILLYLGRTMYKRLWACLALYDDSDTHEWDYNWPWYPHLPFLCDIGHTSLLDKRNLFTVYMWVYFRSSKVNSISRSQALSFWHVLWFLTLWKNFFLSWISKGCVIWNQNLQLIWPSISPPLVFIRSLLGTVVKLV